MTRLQEAHAALNRRVHALYLETEIILHDEPDDAFTTHLDVLVESDYRCNRLVKEINRLEIAYLNEAVA